MDVRGRKTHSKRSRSPQGFVRGGKRSRSPLRGGGQAYKLPKYNEQRLSPFEDDRIGKPILQASYTPPVQPSKRERQQDSPPRHRSSRDEDHHRHHHRSSSGGGHHAQQSPLAGKTFSRPAHTDKFEFSLRIGNLNYQHTEKETQYALFQEFRKYGYIDVKVLGQSRDRHAYVNFIREEDAKRAKRELQDRMIFGRPIRIEWSKTTLIHKLGNHSPSMSDSVSRGAPSNSSFTDHRSMYSSKSFSDSRSFNNEQHLRHRHSSPPSVLDGAQVKRNLMQPDPSATRTLFVGNLELSVTERELREVFDRYGRIEGVDIKAPSHAATAYAFVKYMTITDAMSAKSDMQDRFWGRQRLRIGYGKGSTSAKVFVGNLTSFEDLMEVEKKCDQYGVVKRVDHRDGDSHAYVHFADHDAALIAVHTLKNYVLKSGHSLKIDFSGMFPTEDSPPPPPRSEEPRRQHFGSKLKDDHLVGHRRDVVIDRYQSPERDLRAHLNTARSAGRFSGSKHRSSLPDTQHRSFVNHTRNKSATELTYKRESERKDYPSSRQHAQKSYPVRDLNRSLDKYHNKQVQRPSRTHQPHQKSADSRYRTSSDTRSRENGMSSSTKKRNESKSSDSKESHRDSEHKESSGEGGNFTDITEPPSPESDNLIKDFRQDAPVIVLGEGLGDLSKNFPVAWRGHLLLKNNAFPTRMHLIGGDPHVAELLMKSKDDGQVLKITQRLRLEQSRLDEVNKRINSAGPTGHCFLLALPGSLPSTSSDADSNDATQFRPLKSLVAYLKQKEAAGIVSLGEAFAGEVGVEQLENGSSTVGVLHAFPPCEFAQGLIAKVAPTLKSEQSNKDDHIVAVVMRGTL